VAGREPVKSVLDISRSVSCVSELNVDGMEPEREVSEMYKERN
jgi:hypothetical protein